VFIICFACFDRSAWRRRSAFAAACSAPGTPHAARFAPPTSPASHPYCTFLLCFSTTSCLWWFFSPGHSVFRFAFHRLWFLFSARVPGSPSCPSCVLGLVLLCFLRWSRFVLSGSTLPVSALSSSLFLRLYIVLLSISKTCTGGGVRRQAPPFDSSPLAGGELVSVGCSVGATYLAPSPNVHSLHLSLLRPARRLQQQQQWRRASGISGLTKKHTPPHHSRPVCRFNL